MGYTTNRRCKGDEMKKLADILDEYKPGHEKDFYYPKMSAIDINEALNTMAGIDTCSVLIPGRGQ
jgi:hypothetical protein